MAGGKPFSGWCPARLDVWLARKLYPSPPLSRFDLDNFCATYGITFTPQSSTKTFVFSNERECKIQLSFPLAIGTYGEIVKDGKGI